RRRRLSRNGLIRDRFQKDLVRTLCPIRFDPEFHSFPDEARQPHVSPRECLHGHAKVEWGQASFGRHSFIPWLTQVAPEARSPRASLASAPPRRAPAAFPGEPLRPA